MSVDIRPVIRRAIVDVLTDAGGEHSEVEIAMLLKAWGHPAARSVVRTEMEWLAEEGLIKIEELGPLLAGRVLPDGRDVSEGRLIYDGIDKFKTGE